ncbi:Phospholipase A2-like protein Y52B11A.8 [Caenorhabditis elegans]|uniref:Phospholipase A2-like protein Y52B11A.8 n=1 Tax=Caenorhabditis elegans TaxID=6239 RepID=PA2L_CAEEL|nr:Phospholipase A2-like protein Y52B11A.8 [Caenorhabditis elegans]Q9U256.1 RecName: Full=Phospholipase A2-like protein Y52B11A.8; Flags: Precursor [Caenorhabditis elegans]CAB63390.1 Phospholipase A2-like protein Y52B11A.8 [Caenorhabditis elegans]|eukprot:NP_492859.1 Phospholipase A2-like protein Y52B11A.8 [Caenorhabditis elegans]
MRGLLVATWIFVSVAASATPTTTTKSPPPTTTTLSPQILKAKLPPVVKNATWECGTDEFTKSISEGEIQAKCPKLRDHINSCCLQHDGCYEAQSGQKFCDDTFCSCLERRSRSSKSCHDESAPLFCDLVRTFGDGAYEASGPNASTTEESPAEKDDYDYESHVAGLNATPSSST